MRDRALYDDIGSGYSDFRRPDPRIATLILEALGEAWSVVSVGTGAGSYEPTDRRVVAVDPSGVMISQRRPENAPVVQAVAEALPLRSGSFDVAMAILTIHHWDDVLAGLSEMRRVATRQVVLTFDPVLHRTHWICHYVPEIAERFSSAPPVEQVANALGESRILPVPLSHNTPDGMTVAYWRRPEAYLDPKMRAGGSALRQVNQEALGQGLLRLREDLATGAWATRYGDLLGVDEMDYGLRLIAN